ncbi:MAG TPA: glycosyl hydrolase family 28-related protein [Candidatus Acidoferrales bacterium]|nr:glycosyl hydrolase family 28-related protein [Candidatus Acidoferrales bacterium]
MTAVLAPELFQRFQNASGVAPLVGGKLFTYIAGTSTKQVTYTDSTMGTMNTNPIILASDASANVWLDPALVYKFVLAPANDTDPPTSPIKTIDNVYPSLNISSVYPLTGAETTAGVTPTNYTYPSLNVLRYGADPSNVTDSLAAFNNALAVAAVNGGTVFVPAGTYKISSTLQWTSTKVYLAGVTQQVSILSFANSTGDLISIGDGVTAPSYVGVSRFTVTASVSKSSGAAIRVQNSSYVFLDNIILGLNLFTGFQFDGGAQQLFYFLNTFAIQSGTNGILIGASGGLVQELRIANSTMNRTTGPGINVVNASGVYLSKLVAAGNNGVLINPGNGQYVTALFCDQVIADTCPTNNWLLAPTGTGVITNISLVNCWGSSCTNAGGAGFSIVAGGTVQGVTLTNFIAENNQGPGISCVAGTKIGLVNCQVGANSQASSGAYHGAYMNTTDWSIIGGSYGANNARISNKQGYGVMVDTLCTNYQIIGINARGNITGAILDVPTVASKMISKNQGYNPLPSTAITVGASPFTYTNLTGDAIIVQVSSGTVSSVQFGNVAAFATNTSVILPNGQAVVVTYTGLPTMNYYGT